MKDLQEALREVVEFRPSAKFSYVDPVGGDLLIAVAEWMDWIDDDRGQDNREVQEDLRRWARLMYEARVVLENSAKVTQELPE